MVGDASSSHQRQRCPEPFPIITVNNVIIEDNITLLTGQRILFSAGRTSDNVPIDHLDFQWDWGDGTATGGKGAYSQQHNGTTSTEKPPPSI